MEWQRFRNGLSPFVADAIGKRPIVFDCKAETFEFETDPDLLKELLLNLLRNAVEATGAMEDGDGADSAF